MSVHKSPGRRLRNAWQTEPIAIPGVFNALVGRMAERLGFQAVYLSGAALSASLALPDVGVTTLSEFVEAARNITAATKLPLVCDADTGFGEALETTGFAVIVGHDVPEALASETYATMKAYFALPLEAKLRESPPERTKGRGYLPIGIESVAKTLAGETPPDL